MVDDLFLGTNVFLYNSTTLEGAEVRLSGSELTTHLTKTTALNIKYNSEIVTEFPFNANGILEKVSLILMILYKALRNRHVKKQMFCFAFLVTRPPPPSQVPVQRKISRSQYSRGRICTYLFAFIRFSVLYLIQVGSTHVLSYDDADVALLDKGDLPTSNADGKF